tara:strand:+ start:643 stop:1002 length:360 start_codon:yes stop_codon:yes gene_type:complete
MQHITIPLGGNVNSSVQVGDMVYYSSPSPVPGSGFFTSNSTNITQLGVVTQVGANSISVIYDDSTIAPPNVDDFIMFAKNHEVNSSSVIGYYAEVKFMNYSKEKIELFSIGSEVSESSK